MVPSSSEPPSQQSVPFTQNSVTSNRCALKVDFLCLRGKSRAGHAGKAGGPHTVDYGGGRRGGENRGRRGQGERAGGGCSGSIEQGELGGMGTFTTWEVQLMAKASQALPFTLTTKCDAIASLASFKVRVKGY